MTGYEQALWIQHLESVMNQISFIYDQISARLTVEGLPDQSIGHSAETLGIISSWKLELVGFPELEGKREHLESLMIAVVPYARHCLSGIKKSFGNVTDPVSISPSNDGHLIQLISSQEGIKPLELYLDDAQLADLVRCLDDLRCDKNVAIDWNIPKNKPLRYRDISSKIPFIQRISASFLGVSIVTAAAWIGIYIPIPPEIEPNKSTISVTK